MWKICSSCKKHRALYQFSRSKLGLFGLQGQCKDCVKEYKKDYRENNKEIICRYLKNYYQNNKEYFQNYKENNKEHKQRYLKNYKNSPAKYNSNLRKSVEMYEDVRKSSNNNVECKCTYCNYWFEPSKKNLSSRLEAINGSVPGECRLYCSEQCKQACPTYRKQLYSSEQSVATSREVQPELRKLVLARDNYICQRCNKHKDDLDVALHCHHIEGILWEPLQSADIDMCITFCEDCHKEVHQIEGCTYNDMKCA
jgi:hypothetical protein